MNSRAHKKSFVIRCAFLQMKEKRERVPALQIYIVHARTVRAYGKERPYGALFGRVARADPGAEIAVDVFDRRGAQQFTERRDAGRIQFHPRAELAVEMAQQL